MRRASLAAVAVLAESDAPDVFELRAERAYHAARVRYLKEPSNLEAAWQFGRACFDRADLAKHDSDKLAFAEEGMRACRQGLVDDPKSAWAHYYLGLDIGESASAKGLGALRLLHEMNEELTAAARLDETIDYAGPDRSLGMLYRDAPGVPLSIGSRTKAIEHLTKSVRLSPSYPENSICLAEAYLKWNEYAQARRVAKTIPYLMVQGRKQFSGAAWESSWIDWNQRWVVIQARFNESSHFQTPHSR